MKKLGIGTALVVATITLAACNGGDQIAPNTPQPVVPGVIADVAIPNFSGAIAGGGSIAGSFDLVYVDQANHTAQFTDRNNKSIDQIGYSVAGVPTALKQFIAGLGFTGCQGAAIPGGAIVADPGCPSVATPTVGAAITANSGPNGLHGIVGTTTVTAGDVQKIVVFDSVAGAFKAAIPTTSPVLGNTGFRTDEGCVLPAAKSPLGVPIAAYSNTSEAARTVGAVTRGMTYFTFVNLATNAVLGQLVMPNSSGQELCLFDTANTPTVMYYTDDGDLANPHTLLGAGAITNVQAAGANNPNGSLDGIHIANLLTAFAAAPAGVNGFKYIVLDLNANVVADTVSGIYAAGAVGAGATRALADYTTTPLTGFWRRASGFDNVAPLVGCTPAGFALNTTNNVDAAQSCRPALGNPLALLIVNRNTGALIAQPLGGGADQVQYDPVSQVYLTAAARWVGSGLAPGSCAATPSTRVCTPVLSIVNATAPYAIKARVQVGNNAHGVDFDSAYGLAFMPYSNSAFPAGCGTCSTYPNGGLHVIKFR